MDFVAVLAGPFGEHAELEKPFDCKFAGALLVVTGYAGGVWVLGRLTEVWLCARNGRRANS